MPAWNLQFNGDYIHEDGGEAYVRQPSGVYVRRDLYTGRDLPPIDHLIQQNPVESIPLGAQNFAQLLDVPDYAPDVNGSVAGRGVEVNAAADGLVFALGLKLRRVGVANNFSSRDASGYVRLSGVADYPLGSGFEGGSWVIDANRTRWVAARASFVACLARANIQCAGGHFAIELNDAANQKYRCTHTATFDNFFYPVVLFSGWLAPGDHLAFQVTATSFVAMHPIEWNATVLEFY